MIESSRTDIVLKGIGVSPGINIGRAYLVDGGSLETPAYCYLDTAYIQSEVKRFKNAVQESKDQLLKIRGRLLKDGKGKEHIRIIDAHLMMLEDKMLIDDTIKTIKKEKVNAELAIKMVMREIREFFDSIDDEYIRERGSDIDHICDRVLKNLMGKKHETIADIKEEVIVVAHDLAPTDTAQMVKGRVLGFVTDIGGKTSHTAIVARSLEIPAVVGLESISQKVNAGDTLIIDGTSGLVVINPSKKTVKDYQKKKGQYADYEKLLHHYRKLPAEMQDGRRIRLMGNIEMAEEIPSLVDHGAEGIGLYRTEFLYLNRKDLPSEEEHFKVYKDVVERVSPHPTIIRTLDIGGDKFLSQMELAPEMNPAMGLRAIRFCLKEPDIFQRYRKIDVIIRGNPEVPIMELLTERTPENIKNLAYREGNRITYTQRVIHDLPEDIYPRRNLRNSKYSYHMMGIKVDLIRTAVGCNYRCKFCFEYGKDFDGNFIRWQGRSAQSLFNEIKEIDAPIVGWVDDDMTTSMKTLEELSDLLLKNKVQRLYMGTGRIDHVLKSNVETLKKMEQAGFLALSFGVESLKRETLKLYGKGQTPENIEKAMRMMQETNILLICNFILGSPGETKQDIMNMLWFGRRWNADTIVTNRFRIQGDSPLYELIYDHQTGKVRPGMERIEGGELARIKHTIKFAQRTPFRIMLTLLKLYRHKGMFIDPLYMLCCILETVTKYTWLEKTMIFPALLKAAKRFFALSFVYQFFRLIAAIAMPPLKAINWLLEFIDKHLGISTTILPKLFSYLDNKVFKKQKIRAQIAERKHSG